QTPRRLIELANENYNRFFEAFLEQHQIRIAEYDAVIGPEFVRGGRQLCIRHLPTGMPSAIATRILSRMEPMEPFTRVEDKIIITVPARGPAQRSRIRGAAGNELAMAMLGHLVGDAAVWINDKGIEQRFRGYLTQHGDAIANILQSGEGVLI